MAVYVVGDIQGCFESLQRLLKKIEFDPSRDKLWFAGDIVNRGPKSLEVLRFIKGLGDSATTVLGNHDLHLLAVSQKKGKLKNKDTLQEVLDAPDKIDILEWLRHRPLFHYENNFGLLHAGLPPQWDLEMTKALASDAEKVLQGGKFNEFLKQMYGNMPDKWSDSLQGWDRMRFIVNCFTRLRYCDAKGRLALEEKGPPGSQSSAFIPWFQIPTRKTKSIVLIFGHWSTLGFLDDYNCFGIDTGCLWGGKLTALRISGKIKRISIACSRSQNHS